MQAQKEKLLRRGPRKAGCPRKDKGEETMSKFIVIGERLSTTAPAINRAFSGRDPEPILKRAKEQLDAGATYLDVNIGPAEND